MFQKMFSVLHQSFPQPDIIVYLHRNVDSLQNNIQKRGRNYENLISSNYLEGIQNSYFDYFKNILSFPVLIIDLKDFDFIHNKSQYEHLKTLLKKEYRPGVHRISLLT